MRVLFVIPHYFKAKQDDSTNKSLRISAKSERILAISETISRIHQTFGKTAYGIDHPRVVAHQSVSTIACDIDVIVCTHDNDHLLDELPLSPTLYRRVPAVCEPGMLGFAAHRVLARGRGLYDYYCYVEDDIGMADPLFFAKKSLFDKTFGPTSLIQPNRFEKSSTGMACKAYVDYILHSRVTAAFQDITINPTIKMDFLGEDILFERTSYPSAGSFFLNGEQLDLWSTSPHFESLDTSYLSSLDSAASLSVMKVFSVYKPVLDQAWFLEVEHLSPRWVDTIGRSVNVAQRSSSFIGLPGHVFE
jgi:hypothetical protein